MCELSKYLFLRKSKSECFLIMLRRKHFPATADQPTWFENKPWYLLGQMLNKYIFSGLQMQQK